MFLKSFKMCYITPFHYYSPCSRPGVSNFTHLWTLLLLLEDDHIASTQSLSLSSGKMVYLSLPSHCANETNSTELFESVNNDSSVMAENSIVSPEEAGCYQHLDAGQRKQFLIYESIVGGYCICIVGIIGLIGNVLSLVVLGQKEMQRNNCFNKLLIGKIRGNST